MPQVPRWEVFAWIDTKKDRAFEGRDRPGEGAPRSPECPQILRGFTTRLGRRQRARGSAAILRAAATGWASTTAAESPPACGGAAAGCRELSRSPYPGQFCHVESFHRRQQAVAESVPAAVLTAGVGARDAARNSGRGGQSARALHAVMLRDLFKTRYLFEADACGDGAGGVAAAGLFSGGGFQTERNGARP